MKVFLADLVHNHHAGDNQVSGEQDFVVPLNIANIASFVRSQIESDIEIKLFKYPTLLINELKSNQPDVIGFSHYIWNTQLNLKIVDYVKKCYPNLIVVFGGPTIRTARGEIESFLRSHGNVDCYILYEGERPFLELIRQVSTFGTNFRERDVEIPSCAYLTSKGLIYREAPQVEPVENLPSPYLDGTLDEFLETGLIPLFETNRGCPFQCTFCTWGIAALNKVRKFSIERVFSELEHVASGFPNIPAWIIGDANFGMLKRDLDIARKIRNLKQKAQGLKHILTWESKNTTERNFEISKIMNNVVNDALVALQTLDPDANDAIKRGNISQKDTGIKVARFRNLGARVQTHILSGLPAESFSAQLKTITKAFEFDFDDIQIFSTILLPGSEMESATSREKYQIRTKYRLRAGGYGQYQGLTAIDCEEIIRSTSKITEAEMQRLRSVHWLVWFGWNHGFLKPLWRFAHKVYGINPAEVIFSVTNPELRQTTPRMSSLLTDFNKDSEAEWFDSHEELAAFYSSLGLMDDSENDNFLKAEFKYNALMLIDQELFGSLVDLNITIIKELAGDSTTRIWRNVHACLLESVCFPNSIISGKCVEEKYLDVEEEFFPYFCARNNVEACLRGGNSVVRLIKPKLHLKRIQEELVQYKYHENKFAAVTKTLGANPNAFSYQLQIFNGVDDYQRVSLARTD